MCGIESDKLQCVFMLMKERHPVTSCCLQVSGDFRRRDVSSFVWCVFEFVCVCGRN